MAGFPFTPQLLEMGLERLGIAAAQLKAISPEVKKALLKLLVQAASSGDANAFLEKRLRWIDEYEEGASERRREPRTVKATARVVEGQFVDPEPRGSGGGRTRRR